MNCVGNYPSFGGLRKRIRADSEYHQNLGNFGGAVACHSGNLLSAGESGAR